MKFTWALLAAVLWAGSAQAKISSSEVERLQNASAVLDDFRSSPDKGVPEDLWNRAQCVVVIPSLKKAGFIFGGEYGKGVMSCRTSKRWSAPVFMQLAKGSWGFQIGAEEVDLLLLLMNQRGVDKLLQDKVTIGADASATAGPVGRSAQAATDAQMSAEILSYSRSRGLFAGVDISGGVLQPDKDANARAYGESVTARDIVSGAKVPTPAAAKRFISILSREARATTGR